jgi:hypothetical protein
MPKRDAAAILDEILGEADAPSETPSSLGEDCEKVALHRRKLQASAQTTKPNILGVKA